MVHFNVCAMDFDMENALRETYQNCVGIDDALHDMKVKAGINTAVTGVGTGLGIGATAAGISKSKTDAEIKQKFAELTDLAYGAYGTPDNEVEADEFLKRVHGYLYSEQPGTSVGVSTEQNKKIDEIEQLNAKSKKLGNWRTGLLAGNTATNIAGAAIAGTNKVNKTVAEQIDACKLSIKNLRTVTMRAKFSGEDITEAEEIISACGDFEYVDISKINNRAAGGMTASIVGVGTGTVGTITSALANSDKIRNSTNPNAEQKEKNLNTTANVMAAGSAVASAAATVFNATQIKAIKDVAQIAQKCTEVLK